MPCNGSLNADGYKKCDGYVYVRGYMCMFKLRYMCHQQKRPIVYMPAGPRGTSFLKWWNACPDGVVPQPWATRISPQAFFLLLQPLLFATRPFWANACFAARVFVLPQPSFVAATLGPHVVCHRRLFCNNPRLFAARPFWTQAISITASIDPSPCYKRHAGTHGAQTRTPLKVPLAHGLQRV